VNSTSTDLNTILEKESKDLRDEPLFASTKIAKIREDE